MIAPLWLWTWLALGGCTPDETGYGDPDDTGPRMEDDAAGGGSPDLEPGDLEGRVFYTALRGLSDNEVVPVTFLAVSGTFPGVDDLTVSVEGGAESTARTVDGGAVVVVDASLHDTVRLLDGTAPLGSIVLSYDLGAVDAPAAPAEDLDEDGMVGSLAGEGEGVAVGDGAIPGVSAPYLAYNSTSGAVRKVDAGQADVILPAADGDVVCVAKLDAEGRPGPAQCALF